MSSEPQTKAEWRSVEAEMFRLRLVASDAMKERNEALAQLHRQTDLGALPWRTGTKVGRNLYDAHDNPIGYVDTPELATLVVEAVNR